MDLNATLRRIKDLQEENKEQARLIAQLRGTISMLAKQLNEISTPTVQPYYPCPVCHDIGLVREWKEDEAGVDELPCPEGCEIRELPIAQN